MKIQIQDLINKSKDVAVHQVVANHFKEFKQLAKTALDFLIKEAEKKGDVIMNGEEEI